MRRVVIISLLCLTALGCAEDYLGLYLQGSKIGYASYSTHDEMMLGRTVHRSDSKTVMSAGLLGGAMTVEIDSSTWTNLKGQPLKMAFLTSSGGRTQRVTADFRGRSVRVAIDNSGTKTVKNLLVPVGQKIVDDPMQLALAEGVKVGKSQDFYVLDPTTVSFIRNQVVLKGDAKTTVNGKEIEGKLIEIVDPRVTTRVFVGPKGELLKAEGPMGIEMIPESKDLALGTNAGYSPKVDLALSTSIKPETPLNDPGTLSFLKLRVTGHDLASIPSDDHQTTAKQGAAWIVTVHPPRLDPQNRTTISQAAAEQPKWTGPDLDIPSDNPKFRELAKSIVGRENRVQSAAMMVRSYVYRIMRPNTGIGVVRNANEILQTREGVCRDYAILTATLLRAARIPAKLSSGLVSWDGTFYYHAWAQAWDGKRWIGIDSTTPDKQISAAHIELATGSLEQAFTFSFLDNVKVQVLDARRG